MSTTIKPIVYKCKETPGFIDTLSSDVKKAYGPDSDILLDRPAIYVHVWKDKWQYNIYIGNK